MRSWNRASFEFHTRPTKVKRRVLQRDLLLPAHHSRLRLLGACVVCGFCIALLYVWTTMMLVALVLNESMGRTFWVIVLGAAVVTSAVLYALASRQMARYREYVS